MGVADDIQTALYRHFGADGSLLYVGISLSWPARTKAHSRSSHWFDQVARVEVERYPNRAAALEAEREAIKREGPKHNVVHNRPEKPARRIAARGAVDTSPAASRFLSARERRRLEKQNSDPLLKEIAGPHAIVGPALIYRDDCISVLVAHGSFGTPGNLTEIVLGSHFPDLPAWTHVCDTVLTIRRPNDITMDEAREKRIEIVRKLRAHLEVVQDFQTDLALATAYATQFPSNKSRRILDDVAAERGAVS